MTFFKNLSFKVKTILGIALIESILLAIIYFTSINSLNKTNEQQIQLRAEETSNLISLSVRNSLLTYDVGNTEQFISALAQSEGLVYIHIQDEVHKTFTFAGNREYLNKKREPDLSLEQANQDGVYDVIKPVKVDEHVIGYVILGLSVKKLSEFINNVAYRIQAIAAFEVLLSAIFSYTLGWLLTRRFLRLKEAANKITQTNELQIINDDSKDEIGVVSQAFNEMTISLIQSKAELETNNRKLAEIFENTRDGMAVISNNGSTLKVNPAFLKLINHYEISDEISAIQFKTLLEKNIDINDYQSAQWLNNFSRSNYLHLNDTNIRFAKPNARFINVKHKTIKDDKSQINSILFFVDLTHLEVAEKLKSEFIAHASHELRTPLTCIHGFSQLMSMTNTSKAELTEYTEIISKQSSLLVDMTLKLLDYSKIKSEGPNLLNLKRVSLTNLVNKTIDDFPLPNNRKAVIKHFNQELRLVLIDKKSIKKALYNILSNAYKYSSEEDFVELFLTEFMFKQDGEQKRGNEIRIVDHGIGMTKTELGRGFEPFWRADSSGQTPGTGLDMSIVKEILELHSATIEIVSEVNIGTEVIIKFYR